VSPRKSTEFREAPVIAAGAHRKPKPDLYTVLLAIALVAVLIGILFLYLEMSDYKFDLKGGPSPAMILLVFSPSFVTDRLSFHSPQAEHGCSRSPIS
jgi:hypothetical protein